MTFATYASMCVCVWLVSFRYVFVFFFSCGIKINEISKPWNWYAIICTVNKFQMCAQFKSSHSFKLDLLANTPISIGRSIDRFRLKNFGVHFPINTKQIWPFNNNFSLCLAVFLSHFSFCFVLHETMRIVSNFRSGLTMNQVSSSHVFIYLWNDTRMPKPKEIDMLSSRREKINRFTCLLNFIKLVWSIV